MFGIGVDEIGKLLGGAAAACVIGLLSWIGARRNKAEERAPNTPPTAMGFVLDGDTATAILTEIRGLRQDQQRWRAEDVAQGKLDAAYDQIRSLQAQLTTASGVTHNNQDVIRDEVVELRKLIEGLKMQ